MSAPIVVGFDPHGTDDGPVHFGVAAARFTGAPLIVAAVYGGHVARDRHADAEIREELSADARAALDRVRTRLEGEAGIQSEVQLVEARSASHGLHVALEDTGAALAVVGSTSRGAAERLVGSTAERVIHGAPCPVAVVPHGFAGGEPRTVGVAYTRSPEGEQALVTGVALARATGATLRVITVLREQQGTVVTPHASDVGRAQIYDEQSAADHRVAVAEAVDAALAEAGGGNVEAEPELLYGDPADALIDFSDSLDLLVMGSRAYGPARAVLLGGVSRRVTATSQCPVIVLPRGAEHPLRELFADR
jgi:nucleotide-binding universal stress UspA family protein